MRLFVVVLLAVLCVLNSASASVQSNDPKWLEQEFNLLRLFKHINQPSYYNDHVEIGNAYDISAHFDDYKNPEVASYYYQIYQFGLLPRGEVFSVFHDEHLQQAIALYNVLFAAKDFDTFYNTAVWARQHINEGVFLYSLSVAVVHRADTNGFVLPPIYEIYPYYFFNSDVIQEAYKYKQQYDPKNHEDVFTIEANYSAQYEQSLSYFTEDVGINSFYYYYNIYYPSWLSSEIAGNVFQRRGELFYFVHQQILARYYLERLSNNLGQIPLFNWEGAFETGYYPNLEYPTGVAFPARQDFVDLEVYFQKYYQTHGVSKYVNSYTYVQDFELRIHDAIDHGFVHDVHGNVVNLTTEVLGNLINSNPDSPNYNYYGDIEEYARHLLGYSFQTVPSALEHYETSLRDPAFYQLYQHFQWYFQQYQWNLPAYTQQELTFKGVEVTNVTFDKLVTYFEEFYTDLSNAIYVTPEEFNKPAISIAAKQNRLNHHPFTYSIKVNSDLVQQASVFVYIGPQYDHLGQYVKFGENRQNFVLFDHFVYDLVSGENVISRDSNSSSFYYADHTNFRDLFNQVQNALQDNEDFISVESDSYFGFPNRFLLPKGTPSGLGYQFFVIVSPFISSEVNVGEVEFVPFVDGYPLGYPFERPIYHDQIYINLPNAYVQTENIYHINV